LIIRRFGDVYIRFKNYFDLISLHGENMLEKINGPTNEQKEELVEGLKFGVMTGMSGDLEAMKNLVFGKQAGILGNFKGIGKVLLVLAISFGVGVMIVERFMNQTGNDSEAYGILEAFLGLFDQTVGWLGIGIIMLFGIIFMRYMD